MVAPERFPWWLEKPLRKQKNILDNEGFDIVIQDSVYVDTLPASGVVKQVPESDAVVKVNRTVYLTINRAVPPMIDMPNLIGYSYRNAQMNLSSLVRYRAIQSTNLILPKILCWNNCIMTNRLAPEQKSGWAHASVSAWNWSW